jgi:hypothetical protein
MKYNYGVVVNIIFNGRLQYQIYSVVAENDRQAEMYAEECVRQIVLPRMPGMKAEDIFVTSFMPGAIRNYGPALAKDVIAFEEFCQINGIVL